MILSCQNINKSFVTDDVLKDVSFHLEEREKAAEEIRREKTAKQIEESKRFYKETAKPGSLAAKAAMVQKYNEAHEKRGKNK